MTNDQEIQEIKTRPSY